MKVFTLEYEIVYFEEKKVHVLIPRRIVEGTFDNNTITCEEGTIFYAVNAFKEGINTCYVDYLDYEFVKAEIEKSKLPFDECVTALKKKYKEDNEKNVYYIENEKLYYLSVNDFAEKYKLYVDYKECMVKEVTEKNYTLKEFVDVCEKSILFQTSQIKRIASTLINNNHFTDKKKIILNGKMGTGKTKIVDIIASTLNFPIAKINNYSGESLSSAFLNIYLQKQKNDNPAIIFIDDIHRGYSQVGKVEGDLLIRIIKEMILKATTMPLQINENTTVLFDPSDITFIIAVDLEKHVFDQRKVGIGNNLSVNETLSLLKEELIDANFDIIDMNDLGILELCAILKDSDISPLNEYKKILEAQDANLVLGDEFYNIIASKASKLGKGAKGLRIVLDSILIDIVADAQYTDSKSIVLSDEKILAKINKNKG